MKTTDFPVRAQSDRDTNFRDNQSGDSAYKSFTKDKRNRTSKPQALYSTASYKSEQRSGEAGGERRHSFNPNFTRDNRLIERGNKTYGERSFGREDKPAYSRERNFNREERPAYNREGGFNRERNFNREDRPAYNREGNFNREERPTYNREGGFNRERNFNREERPSYNRERNFNREERPAYNREGGFNRERNFNREDRPTYSRERNFNAEGGEKSPRQSRFGAPKREGFAGKREGFAGKRTMGSKPFGERAPKAPKPFVNTANEYTIDNYPSYAAPKIEGEIRLNRYISMSGICSRREADEYITSGAVTVNGEVVTELGTKVHQDDVICYNGKQIFNEKKVYIVMNKPKGFVTTLDDPHADKSVMDLVKNACTERIYPVGRLDKSSVGVLLLTNDGDLAKKLTHPTYEKKKIYQVSLDKHLTRADMERLIMGITLEDGDIAADDICYVEDPKCKNAVGLEIHSGRNRIVRRMFEHVGYRVNKLDRVYFAGLTKQKLKRGEWRFLTEKEVSMLKSGNYE